MNLLINNVVVYHLGSSFDRGLHPKQPNICGSSTADRKTRVSMSIPFTEKTFTFTIAGAIENNTSPNLMSWGIRDLQIYAEYGETNAVQVASELSDKSDFGNKNWTVSGGNPLTQCGAEQLLGGFNHSGPETTFVRAFSNLVDHTFLTFKLKAFWLDSVDTNDSIIFYVDGKIVHE